MVFEVRRWTLYSSVSWHSGKPGATRQLSPAGPEESGPLKDTSCQDAAVLTHAVCRLRGSSRRKAGYPLAP